MKDKYKGWQSQYYFIHFGDVGLSRMSRSWQDNYTIVHSKYMVMNKDFIDEDNCVLYHHLQALVNIWPICISGLCDGIWMEAHHLELSDSGNIPAHLVFFSGFDDDDENCSL